MRGCLIPSLPIMGAESVVAAFQVGGAYGEEGRGVLIVATFDRPHQPQYYFTGVPGSN
jgi:hypothetical protein